MNTALVAVTGSGEIEERVAQIEKYLNDMSLHRDSRKGLDGARGEQGLPGRDSVVVGPQGPPGKDVDITQVVEAALRKVRAEFDEEHKMLAHVVRHELTRSGVIDEDGNAVLIPGPAGRDGRDSKVEGPKGDVGPVGKDGVDAKSAIGNVVAGAKASVSVREENGTHVFDFVLPRGERGETGTAGRDGADSVVPGPRGEIGPEGLRGVPGEGLSKAEVIALVLDMKRRGSL